MLGVSRECRFRAGAEDILFRDTRKLSVRASQWPQCDFHPVFLLPEPTLLQPGSGSVRLCPKSQEISATRGRQDSWAISKKLELQS